MRVSEASSARGWCLSLDLTLPLSPLFSLPLLPLSLLLFLPLDLPFPRASTSMGSADGSPSVVVQRRCAWTIFTISPRTDR